jgi:AraC-like DNA-binding protein
MKFRKAVGHSILEEIQAVRLNEVKRLLADPAILIGSMAARTGYASENFLARLFKRTCGMTMSAWRRSRNEPAKPSTP